MRGNRKYSDETVTAARVMAMQGMSCPTIAKLLGVSSPWVWTVTRGVSRREVPMPTALQTPTVVNGA